MVSTIERPALDVRAALQNGEIYAVFQRQVSLATGGTVAVEAFCRWNHPTGRQVTASEIVDSAERSGVIQELGRFMLRQCLDLLDGLKGSSLPWEVAVNVSPTQLLDKDFVEHVYDEVIRRRVSPGSLILEITENLPIVNLDSVRRYLRALRTAGVEISLDEFGEGFASLEKIDELPLSELKIAGTAVRGAQQDQLASLRECVEYAHERGLRVVAEGVETQTHLEAAVRLGCDRAQGFLMGTPTTSAELLMQGRSAR